MTRLFDKLAAAEDQPDRGGRRDEAARAASARSSGSSRRRWRRPPSFSARNSRRGSNPSPQSPASLLTGPPGSHCRLHRTSAVQFRHVRSTECPSPCIRLPSRNSSGCSATSRASSKGGRACRGKEDRRVGAAQRAVVSRHVPADASRCRSRATSRAGPAPASAGSRRRRSRTRRRASRNWWRGSTSRWPTSSRCPPRSSKARKLARSSARSAAWSGRLPASITWFSSRCPISTST